MFEELASNETETNEEHTNTTLTTGDTIHVNSTEENLSDQIVLGDPNMQESVQNEYDGLKEDYDFLVLGIDTTDTSYKFTALSNGTTTASTFNYKSLFDTFEIDEDDKVNVTSYMCEYTQIEDDWSSTTQYCEIVFTPSTGYYKVEAAKIDITSVKFVINVSLRIELESDFYAISRFENEKNQFNR